MSSLSDVLSPLVKVDVKVALEVASEVAFGFAFGFALGLTLGFAFETYDVGVGVEEDCIRCRAVFPVAVQEARRRDVAEYIARANFELKFGSLQLNIEDGAIVAYLAYPMSAVLAEGDEAIKMAFGLPASLLDVHSNELIKIASGENE